MIVTGRYNYIMGSLCRTNNDNNHISNFQGQETKSRTKWNHVSEKVYKDFKVSHNSAFCNEKFNSKIRIYFTLEFGFQ